VKGFNDEPMLFNVHLCTSVYGLHWKQEISSLWWWCINADWTVPLCASRSFAYWDLVSYIWLLDWFSWYASS